ncbi:aminoglycoside phosphotransferase (APT) family kinase protein [Kribbella italica]|uniref:Aminoglycoside phosphotransferase (APT) family kinase protein n=1 Tax=Kribbella italica TaxID=1540520 RepID=A0A7W9MW33_9ACTN|nr:aminoglycoside phosphotransferase family protein [Kribbella italica]MBB5838454.1 aminoglycoside phosphotransferase (APT) family kinase protein [Kribbella italica]
MRAPTPRIGPGMVATGAAALEVAERFGLPAPRLLGVDLLGEMSGVPATLESGLRGSSRWAAPPGIERLRAAGAVLARVHAISIAPRDALPVRLRPIAVDDFAADRRTGSMPTTTLLQAADEAVAAYGLPAGEQVFLHGDVWPGNLLWAGDEIAALIDWKTAGVGARGVDFSELRKQAAISFGPDAPAEVLQGYEQATATKAEHVAYWDAVAALNTPTELYDATATIRRDAFLRAALSSLREEGLA